MDSIVKYYIERAIEKLYPDDEDEMIAVVKSTTIRFFEMKNLPPEFRVLLHALELAVEDVG